MPVLTPDEKTNDLLLFARLAGMYRDGPDVFVIITVAQVVGRQGSVRVEMALDAGARPRNVFLRTQYTLITYLVKFLLQTGQ